MSFIEWTYKSWLFLRALISKLLLVSGVGGFLLFSIFQSAQFKDLLKSEIQEYLLENNDLILEIDIFTGLIPFNLKLIEVEVLQNDDQKNLVFSAKQISAYFDVSALIFGQFDVQSLEIDSLNVGNSVWYGEGNFAENIPSWMRAAEKNRFEIEELVIREGEFAVPSQMLPKQFESSDSLIGVHKASLRAFMEFDSEQRFFQIESFKANLSNTVYDSVAFGFQFYNDDNYFEINNISLEIDENKLSFSVVSGDVDVREDYWQQQLKEASFNVNNLKLNLEESIVKLFFPNFNANGDLNAKGNFVLEPELLTANAIKIELGENFVQLAQNNGLIWNRKNSNFDLEVIQASLDREIVRNFNPDFVDVYLENTDKTEFNGVFSKSGNTFASDVFFRIDNEQIFDGSLNGKIDFSQFQVAGKLSKINLSHWNSSWPKSDLNASFSTEVFRKDSLPDFTVSFDAEKSTIESYRMDDVSGTLSLQNGVLIAKTDIRSGVQRFSIKSEIDTKASGKIINADGTFSNINIDYWFPSNESIVNTSLNGRYNIQLRGNDAHDVSGIASVDFSESLVGKDTVEVQQIYADINGITSEKRNLRVSSSVLDFEILGDFTPQNFVALVGYWSKEALNKLQSEIFLMASTPNTANKPAGSVDLEYRVMVKDLPLLERYTNVQLNSELATEISGTMKADSSQLFVTLMAVDDSLKLGDTVIEKGVFELSTSMFSRYKIAERATINTQFSATRVQFGNADLKDVSFFTTADSDEGLVTMSVGSINNTAYLRYAADIKLFGNSMWFVLSEAQVGTKDYSWKLDRPSTFIYDREGRVSVDSLLISSLEESLLIGGVWSELPTDSVTYSLTNVRLDRISPLVTEDYPFSGLVNADFVTRTLQTSPEAIGKFRFTELSLDNRILGDLTASSVLNKEKNRFDTSLKLYTSPNKYRQYYIENEGLIQDIEAVGYFRPQNRISNPADTLFYFDVDFESVDAWVVDYLIADIFTKMEGQGKGKGYVMATQESLDFRADLDVVKGTVTTTFMNATYDVTGPIILDRQEGIVFDKIALSDRRGGTAILDGRVDWNDFKPTKSLDITLDGRNFLFLNNTFSPEVPFYGRVSGSGKIQLAGLNVSPIIRTITPVVITPNSEISIPILDQENVDPTSNFIEFVSDFNQKSKSEETRTQEQNTVVPTAQKSFVELFSMDIQFEVPATSKARLVFDPVINEVLNAEGTGQFQVILDDQEFSLFGRFDVVSGDYLFTGGDLLTRLFTLRPGGAMTWDGDLVNGIVDVEAEYRARPDITPVMPTSGINTADPTNRIYVPINLILEIDGPIFNIQNDFYFEMANSFTITQDANIKAAIDQLNSPDAKLIQATSLLLTGSFIEIAQSNQQRLGNDFDNRVTQSYFARLLSSQINNLLNSNLSNLDIDLNMTGFDQFNQTELGLALRLFDDRLILRREGLIGGQQNAVGDIGATYRINQILSVEVFHRQDPTQNTFQSVDLTTQQTINGVGLEASVQFNTWKELRSRFSKSIKKLFGRKEEEGELPTMATIAN